MNLHEIKCHFHEIYCSIRLAASAASGGAEPFTTPPVIKGSFIIKVYTLISGELQNMPALSFDRDFNSMGLTTIS